jgi:cold shock protein
MEGAIKTLNDRGYGFIKTVEGDVFFHRSELQGVRFEQLKLGDQVVFETTTGDKGPKAKNVQRV